MIPVLAKPHRSHPCSVKYHPWEFQMTCLKHLPQSSKQPRLYFQEYTLLIKIPDIKFNLTSDDPIQHVPHILLPQTMRFLLSHLFILPDLHSSSTQHIAA